MPHQNGTNIYSICLIMQYSLCHISSLLIRTQFFFKRERKHRKFWVAELVLALDLVFYFQWKSEAKIQNPTNENRTKCLFSSTFLLGAHLIQSSDNFLLLSCCRSFVHLHPWPFFSRPLLLYAQRSTSCQHKFSHHLSLCWWLTGLSPHLRTVFNSNFSCFLDTAFSWNAMWWKQSSWPDLQGYS